MILVTGAGGLVGAALVRTGQVTGLQHADLDITDEVAVVAALDRLGPSALINAAAQAGVDRATAEPDRTMAVNGTGPGILARACQERGIRLVHLSSDYVLDAPEAPLLTEDLAPNPRSIYAESKLVGERSALDAEAVVVRLQWVYQPRQPGFFTRAIEAMAAGNRVSLVTDQVGCPTPAEVLAPALLRAARLRPTGLYHLACRGQATAEEWIRRGARHAGVEVCAQLLTRAELGGAHRPARSCLDPSRFEAAFEVRMPHWEAAMDTAMAGWSGRDDRL
jgi:dTDP-4-dehydrorhamnose reductase